MRKLSFVLAVVVLLGGIDAIAQSAAAGRFDGNWVTKMT